MKKNILHYSIGAIVIGGLLTGALSVFANWDEAVLPPPQANAPAPLNVGPESQAKTGGLLLNTGGASAGLIVPFGNVLFGINSGSVGIGTSNPTTPLELYAAGSGGNGMRLTSGTQGGCTPFMSWVNGPTNADRSSIRRCGDELTIGVGDAENHYPALTVKTNGDVTVAGKLCLGGVCRPDWPSIPPPPPQSQSYWTDAGAGNIKNTNTGAVNISTINTGAITSSAFSLLSGINTISGINLLNGATIINGDTTLSGNKLTSDNSVIEMNGNDALVLNGFKGIQLWTQTGDLNLIGQQSSITLNAFNSIKLTAADGVKINRWADENIERNGWARMGSVLQQWGYYNSAGINTLEGAIWVPFNKHFNTVFNIQCTFENILEVNSTDRFCQIGNYNKDGVNIYVQSVGGGASQPASGIYWTAIGN